MPGGSVSISDSHSDKELLLPDTDSEEQSHRSGSKQSASANKPHIRAVTQKDSPPIFSIASSFGGKDKVGQTGKASPGKSPGGKLASNDGSKKQLTTPLLLEEVSDSWEDTEVDDAPFLQGQNQLTDTSASANLQAKVASKPVFKGSPSSGATPPDNKTSSSRPLNTAQKNMVGQASPSKTAHSDVGGDSTVVETTSEEDSDPLLPSDTGKAQSPKHGDANAPGSGKRLKEKSDSAVIAGKRAKKSSQGRRVSFEQVEAEDKKREKITKEKIRSVPVQTLKRMDSHRKELMRLMAAEDTGAAAEAVYQKVAQICTDPDLEDWQKLPCLLGCIGDPCKTLKKEVNNFFDAWVMEKYIENHASKLRRGGEWEKGSRSQEEEDRKRLLSEENEVESDDVNNSEKSGQGYPHPIPLTEEEKSNVLEDFKSTLNWWERRKLNNIKSSMNRDRTVFIEKSELQKIELMRKMQKRLTEEERSFIRKQTRAYHDLLANSGLPSLHIAIKNESIYLVKAYLLAVMAFAPFEIKKRAIQAPQYQHLQAFYYAMTHSSTDMIRMFMETVLESEFLFPKDKLEILHARRPDQLRNGTYGISAFYMAMYCGDASGAADVFMSTLLGWDPNCKITEYSEMKVNLLLAYKSFHYNDSAKVAARDRGHKDLVNRFDKYVNSSHLSFGQKDHLYYVGRKPVPKLKEQPQRREWTEADQKERDAIFKLCDLKYVPEKPSDPVKLSSGRFVQYYTKRDRMIAYERKASLLKSNGKEVPEHLQKKSIGQYARAPFKKLKGSGKYASLFTYPQADKGEVRRTDGDRFIGVPPPLSKQRIENTYQARAKRGALPPRSSSYMMISEKDLPAAPRSVPIIPTLEAISPAKRTPSTGRQATQQTALPDGTPTRLVSGQIPKSAPPSPSNSSGSRKNLRKQQPSASKSNTGTTIPT